MKQCIFKANNKWPIWNQVTEENKNIFETPQNVKCAFLKPANKRWPIGDQVTEENKNNFWDPTGYEIVFLQSHKEATRTETDAKNTVAANHNHFHHEDLEVHFLLENMFQRKLRWNLVYLP